MGVPPALRKEAASPFLYLSRAFVRVMSGFAATGSWSCCCASEGVPLALSGDGMVVATEARVFLGVVAVAG